MPTRQMLVLVPASPAAGPPQPLPDCPARINLTRSVKLPCVAHRGERHIARVAGVAVTTWLTDEHGDVLDARDGTEADDEEPR